jgi:hypothetical protein
MESLPWFDLCKYDRLRELSAIEFFIQVAIRRDLKIKVDNWTDDGQHPDVKHFFPVIQKDPMVSADVLENPPYGLYLFPSLHYLATGNYDHAMGVRPVSIEEYYLHEIWTREPELSHSRRFFEAVTQAAAEPRDHTSHLQRAERTRLQFNSRVFDAYYGNAAEPSYQSWMSEPLYEHQHGTDGTVFFAVNVDLPLPLLREQFEECIQKARASVTSNSDIDTRVRRFDFESVRDDLIDAHVLPYLDLLFWSHLNRKLTYSEMAEVLYPEAEAGDDMVRRTSKVRAFELVEIGTE